MSTEFFQRMEKYRFDRMRLGQEGADFVDVPSMPETRIAIVPLTEGEYDECLQLSALIEAPENSAGWIRRDRRANGETLVRAIRNPNNLEERVFNSIEELQKVLEVPDLNHITDRYMEMVARSSPEIDNFTEEEIEDAKKVLQAIDWNELSGRSWYALRRFLSYLGQEQRLVKLPGRFSTPSLTTTSDGDESTGGA